jgi:hypothetical protein
MNIEESLKLNPNILSENKYSTQQAIWICDKHGNYKQSINSHYLGRTACRKCLWMKRNRTRTLRYNEQLMKQLNVEESIKLNPDILDLTPTSREDAIWICDKHGNYKQKIQYRLYGYVGCPECDKINKYGDRVTYITDTSIADKIDYEQCKINNIDPYKIIKSSKQIIPLKCKHGHKWNIQALSAIKTNAGCPICLRRKDTRPDSIGVLRPDLVEFYSQNNEYSVFEVGVNSLDKVEWICKNNHTFISDVHTQNKIDQPAENVRCPYCSGLKRQNGVNDFATFNSDIMDEWFTEENNKLGLDPHNLPIYGETKAYWKCRNNSKHVWSTSLTIRSNGSGCPYCFKSRQTSTQEVALKMLLDNIGLEANNRQKIDGLEFDVKCNEPKLLIEYHGMAWHDSSITERDYIKYNTAKKYGYDFIIIREIRGVDYVTKMYKDKSINTISYNIGKNYETLPELLQLVKDVICKVYHISITNDINFNEIILEAKKFIGKIG